MVERKEDNVNTKTDTNDSREVVISIKGLNKSYGKHQILHDVSLDIHKGDIFGLIGKNGAGKTTMFKVLLGLSNYQSGTLTIHGKTKNLGRERKKIGFFINANFFPNLNARQNLEYYRRLKGIRDKKEIDRVLELVELSGVKTKYAGYSLGMKQRLGLANAMLGNPEIMILDEPTNGLDPQGIKDIRSLIRKLNHDYGMTIIVSSHILSELQNTADQFCIINEGTVAKVFDRNYLTQKDNVIRLEVEDVEKAKEVLAEAGISVLKEKKETLSLEEVYLSLVGRKEENDDVESL